VGAQGVEVGDVLAPSDRRIALDPRLPAPALIVIEEGAATREQVILRKEVVVMGARAAVQHHDQRSGTHAAGEQPDAVDVGEH
jgi:hypothetical protein